MAQTFISLAEAATKLGVTVDKLNRMREQHEVSGYRDGSTWKFKSSDIDKLAERIADEQEASDDSGELFDLSEAGNEDSDEMVLLSEKELGQSDPGTSSTIIGRSGKQSSDESDIKIITDDERASGSGSDVELVVDPSPTGRDSDVRLVAKEEVQEEPAAEEASEEDSEFLLELDQDSALGEEDEGSVFDEDKPAGSDIALGSDISLGDDFLEESLEDDLILDDDDDDDSDFALSDDVSPSVEAPVQQAQEEEEDEDEDADTGDLVLGGGPGGSDITLGSGDSGISLADPSESGLSLEEPFSIAPLEGQQEDEEVSLEMDSDDLLSLSGEEELGGDDLGEEVEANDDFLLTPMEEAVDESSDDSGSQVIALDESEELADAAMFEEETSPAMGGMLEEDVDEDATVGLEATPFTDTAAAPATTAAGRQAQYSILQVISLSGCTILLLITGVMMYDLIRNMWSWDSPYYVNSSLMDFILGFLPS